MSSSGSFGGSWRCSSLQPSSRASHNPRSQTCLSQNMWRRVKVADRAPGHLISPLGLNSDQMWKLRIRWGRPILIAMVSLHLAPYMQSAGMTFSLVRNHNSNPAPCLSDGLSAHPVRVQRSLTTCLCVMWEITARVNTWWWIWREINFCHTFMRKWKWRFRQSCSQRWNQT